jgi:NAD(P)-dependent dehydrogenase (short-subunit alcohol dehydrogenase family)
MGEAAEVCALAAAVLARSGPVHVLIHSAGGLLPADARTREGARRGFAQNFLGAFLLTRLLEERLPASAPARVIAVGSSAHRLLKTADIDALMHPGQADPPMGSNQLGRYQMRSYQTAKLAVTAWIYGLARRWAGRGVTANLLDPGIVKGKSGSEHFQGPALTGVLMSHVIPFFVAGMDKGSKRYLRLAADPALAAVAGTYFVSGEEKPQGSSPLSLDPPCKNASTTRPRHGPPRSCTADSRAARKAVRASHVRQPAPQLTALKNRLTCAFRSKHRPPSAIARLRRFVYERHRCPCHIAYSAEFAPLEKYPPLCAVILHVAFVLLARPIGCSVRIPMPPSRITGHRRGLVLRGTL